MFGLGKKTEMIDAAQSLPGREMAMPVPEKHYVLGSQMVAPWPQGMKVIIVGMGCFWGAERKFWNAEGVYSTQVGYAGGFTPNPSYEEVCSGQTGHNEVVQVVFDPSQISLDGILQVFWENHDPTQGMRQGNDVGTQYRSGVYCTSAAQKQAVEASRDRFQTGLTKAGFGAITSEIIDAPTFYYAEDYHQQYLGKNPNGYCGMGGTGVACPIGISS
jgi:peptide-methionine (S)-S-oxide reductase